MIEKLKIYFPEFSRLEESQAEDRVKSDVWQVSAFDSNGVPFGTGYSKDKDSARKIAIAEFIERRFVEKLRGSSEAQDWRIDTNPTSCGFAVGFDPLNTKIRSVGEAIERWALSQWIDFNCALDIVDGPMWSPDYEFLRKEFTDLLVYRKSFLYEIEKNLVSFELCSLLAFTDMGCFMGCAVRNDFSAALEHSLVEAHRHLLISRQKRDFSIFPFDRILFFAADKSRAIKSLEVARVGAWSQPQLEFQKSMQNDLFCITRTILKDWIPWEQGPVSRLLY